MRAWRLRPFPHLPGLPFTRLFLSSVLPRGAGDLVTSGSHSGRVVGTSGPQPVGQERRDNLDLSLASEERGTVLWE